MGYIWNVSPDGDLGTRSERCEQKDSRNRYADIVLYILCTLYRDELVAINLMERLGPDLDMKMHLKPFDKGQDIHDIQTHCEYVCISLCICPLLQEASLGNCKN